MNDQPLFVGRLMTSPARTVSRETTLAAAADKLDTHNIGSAAVVGQDTRIEGIITATDIVRATADGADPTAVTVDEFLTEDVLTTAADEAAIDAARRMSRSDINHLPVVDENDGIVGMLTSTDLTDHVARAGVPTEVDDDEPDAESSDADESGADADSSADAESSAADESDSGEAGTDEDSEPTTAADASNADPATED